MTTIFEHADDDGDLVKISDFKTTSGQLSVSSRNTAGDSVTVRMSKAEAGRLHLALGEWLGRQTPGGLPEECRTQFPEGSCVGTRRHPGDCTPNAGFIPSAQEAQPVPPVQPWTPYENVAGRIETEHRVDRAHYTSQFGALNDRVCDLIGHTRSVEDRIKDMHTDLRRQRSAIHTSDQRERTATHEMIKNLLTEIRDRLLEPVPEKCGAPDLSGESACTLNKGHGGRHGDDSCSWPGFVVRLDDSETCGDPSPYNVDQQCRRSAGHLGNHRNVKESRDLGDAGSVEWLP